MVEVYKKRGNFAKVEEMMKIVDYLLEETKFHETQLYNLKAHNPTQSSEVDTFLKMGRKAMNLEPPPRRRSILPLQLMTLLMLMLIHLLLLQMIMMQRRQQKMRHPKK